MHFHQMTINLGQGANCAIEDVAVLSNLLHDCLQKHPETKPSHQEIDALLRQFNSLHLPRASQIQAMSWLTTRVHALDGFLPKVIGRYVMPYIGELFERRPFQMIADAAMLEFLPLSRTSFSGWDKYRNRGNSVPQWLVTTSLLFLLAGWWGYRHCD